MRFSIPRLISKGIKETKKSLSERFSISDYLIWATGERDFTFNLASRLEQTKNRQIDFVNNFHENDYLKLGPEIHAATYAIKMGGQYRLQDSSKWIKKEEKKSLKDTVPQERVFNFALEGLDFSETVLNESGFRNIEDCGNLNTLIVRNCNFINDWFLRALAHQFANSLINLDISNCKLVTDDGLLALGYLKNLKKLTMENLNAKNKEFIAILLEENNPNLEICGINHLEGEMLKKIEAISENEISELQSIKKLSNENQNN